MNSFNMTSHRTGSEVVVGLIGTIDERASIILPELNGATDLVFDFKQVKHINSVGIRFWIQLTQKLPAGITPHYRNVPKVVVDQMLMVFNFMPPKTVIDSFEMPYFCDKCEKSTSMMLQAGVHYDQATTSTTSALRIPSLACSIPDCRMEPDIPAKMSLSFLDNPK